MQSTRLNSCKLCEGFTPQAAYQRGDQIDLWHDSDTTHCASAGLYLSIICKRTAFPFHEYNNFDITKKRKDSTKQPFNEQ